MKKKVIFGLSILLVVLLLTNPTTNDFKEHVGYKEDFRYRHSVITKDYNFLIGSVYLYQTIQYDSDDDRNGRRHSTCYFGIAKNFFKLNYYSE